MNPIVQMNMQSAMKQSADNRPYREFKYVDPHGNSLLERRKTGTVAYWVKGDEVIENDASHIRIIADNPERFGLTRRYIEDVFEQHGEMMGTEGEAREEIIKEVARNGWIRVRHYVNRNSDYWSIQVDNLRRRKNDIDSFIIWAIDKGIMYPSDEIRLLGYDNDEVRNYSFMDGGVNAYLGESTKKEAASL